MLLNRGFGISLLLAEACGLSATATPAATPTATVASTTGDTAAPTSSPAACSVREITVNTQDFRFDPASLNLILGEKVKFTVTNTTPTFHTFTLTSAKDQEFVDLDLGGGETKSAEFTVPTVTADLYLYYKPHESLGMIGGLYVGTSGAGGGVATHDDTQSALYADY